MTVSELIDELRAMPPDANVMLWSRMDEPQQLSSNWVAPARERRSKMAFMVFTPVRDCEEEEAFALEREELLQEIADLEIELERRGNART